MNRVRTQGVLHFRSEPLLLIDDRQAQISKANAVGRQSLGADHDAHAAVREPGLHTLRLRTVYQARQVRHVDTALAEAPAEVLVVLSGEDGRRRHDGHLPSAQRHGRRRSQRDLRLSEADITADQPIHRLAAGHIAEHVADRGGLVDGFGERKATDEGGIGLTRRHDRNGFLSGSIERHRHQPRGGLLDLGADFGASFRPRARP